MTISNNVQRAVYTGSGTTGPFTFSFKVLSEDQVRVIKRLIADPYTETELVIDTDYTVTITGPNAGTVTLLASLSSSYQLIILRSMEFTQQSAFRTQGQQNAASWENAFDTAAMATLQVKKAVDGSIRIPDSEDPDAYSLTLAPAADRAGTVPYFNASGVLTNVTPAEVGIGEFTEAAVPFADTDGRLTEEPDEMYWDTSDSSLNVGNTALKKRHATDGLPNQNDTTVGTGWHRINGSADEYFDFGFYKFGAMIAFRSPDRSGTASICEFHSWRDAAETYTACFSIYGTDTSNVGMVRDVGDTNGLYLASFASGFGLFTESVGDSDPGGSAADGSFFYMGIAGNAYLQVTASAFRLHNDNYLAWSTSGVSTATDRVRMYSPSVGVLELKNGDDNHEIRTYQTEVTGFYAKMTHTLNYAQYDTAGGTGAIFGSTTGKEYYFGNHAACKIGFYAKAPVLLQTGVAVSAAGIHAALVNLGLITA